MSAPWLAANSAFVMSTSIGMAMPIVSEAIVRPSEARIAYRNSCLSSPVSSIGAMSSIRFIPSSSPWHVDDIIIAHVMTMAILTQVSV